MRIRAYLDNNATTRLAPEALAAMMPYLTDLYLNASSSAGELMGAARPLSQAKRALGQLLGDETAAGRFFLTSGASEANSWALHAATFGRSAGHLVASAIEHPSLLSALDALAALGWDVDLVHPRSSGRVEPADIAALLREDTAFVAVMLANNETGVIQPVAEIGALVRDASPAALLHIDATQAVGRIPLSLDGNLVQADLVSLSAHKFHGPNGAGALFASGDIRLPALVHGSQQDGRRGGTPDTAAAAGLAESARLAQARLPLMDRVQALRDEFERALLERVPHAYVLGSGAHRLPNTSSFVVPGISADQLVETLALEGIVIASGSACSSGTTAPSHVLTAMGVDYEDAKAALRVSLSVETSAEELGLALDSIVERALAPA